MNVEKMMHVANRAKTIGTEEGHALSNVVFAILFQEYRARSLGAHTALIPLAEVERLELHLETKDVNGRRNSEVDYDLLVVVAQDELGQDVNSVCTPISLLYSYAAIAAMKTAKVSKGKHQRRCSLVVKYRLMGLWNELLCAIPADEIRERVLSCFNIKETFSTEVTPRLEKLGVL